jgi:hypothetical protein
MVGSIGGRCRGRVKSVVGVRFEDCCCMISEFVVFQRALELVIVFLPCCWT